MVNLTSPQVVVSSLTLKLESNPSAGVVDAFRKGHLSHNNRITSRCRTCCGHHHTSICAPRRQNNERPATNPDMNPPPAASTIQTTSSLNPSAPEFDPNSSNPSLYIDANQAVLLQTALAEVYNPANSSLAQRVRIGQWEPAFVFDAADQRAAGPRVSEHSTIVDCRIWCQVSTIKAM